MQTNGMLFQKAEKLSLFWNWLITPPLIIKDVEKQRKSRLLSVLILFIIPLMIIVGLWAMPALSGKIKLWQAPTFFPALAAILFSALSFLLNRSGHYLTAASIFIFVFVSAPFAAVIADTQPQNIPIAHLMVGGVILASILFQNWSYSIIALLGAAVSILFLPMLAPSISIADVAAVFAANITNGILVLIFVYYRNQFENHRQEEIKSNSKKLEESLNNKQQTQQELLDSESYFRTLFEHSPMIIWEEDFSEVKLLIDNLRKDGISDFRSYFDDNPKVLEQVAQKIKVINVNEYSLEFYRADSKESLITDLPSYFVEESWPVLREEIITLADGKTEYESEIPIRTSWGEIKNLIINVSIPLAYQVSWQRVLVSFVDITERKEAERMLGESEELFRLLTTNARDMIYRMSLPDGKYEFVSPASKELFGYTPDEFYQSPILITKVIHPEWNEYFEKEWAKLLKGKMSPTYEYQIIHKSGEERWMHQRNTLIKNEAGEAQAIEGIVTDITDRKRVEIAIQKQSYLNKMILETTLDGYILADSEGNIKDVNPSYALLIGYSRDELLKMNIRDLEVKIPAEEVDRRIQQMIKQGSDHFETQHKNKHGEILDLGTNISVMQVDDKPMVAAFVRDITEQNQIKIAISQSEEKFRTLFNESPDILAIQNFEKEIIEVNDAAVKMLNYSREELCRMQISDIQVAYTHNELNRISESLQQKGHVIFESELVSKQGMHIPVEISASVIDFQGQSVVLTQSRDISERKIAEQALRESEKKYRQLFELAQEGIWVIDKESNTSFVNPSMAKMLGYEPAEMEGKHLFSFMDERGIEISTNNIKRREQGITEQHDFEFLKKDGQRIFTTMETAPILNDKGDYDGAIAGVIDISERKAAEKIIRDSEANLKSLIDNREDYIWSLDRDYKYITFNKTYADMFFNSYKYDVKKGLDATKNLSPEEYEFWTSKYESAFVGTNVTFEYSYDLGKGLQHFQTTLNPIYNGDVITGVSAISIDISERKQAEEEIHNSREKLRALSAHLQEVREQERSSVARDLHDEFGQILTVLKMDLALIEQQVSGKESDLDISSINKEIHSMNLLLDKTAEKVSELVTQLRPGILDNLGLMAALEWQAEQFQKKTKIQTKLVTKIKEIDLNVDQKTSLFRIVQEALTNIVRHANATEAEISIKKTKNKIILLIKDNGIGIKDAKLEKQGHFGLLGMKERAFILGGKLTIQSEENTGTTLKIELPSS